MQHELTLSQQEIIGIFARLGLNETYNSGYYVVYEGEQGGSILIHLRTQLDRTFNDLARQLSIIGFSRSEVEAVLESLYADH